MPLLFESHTVDLQHPFIRHLIDTGYDDLSFLHPIEEKESVDEVESPERNSETASTE